MRINFVWPSAFCALRGKTNFRLSNTADECVCVCVRDCDWVSLIINLKPLSAKCRARINRINPNRLSCALVLCQSSIYKTTPLHSTQFHLPLVNAQINELIIIITLICLRVVHDSTKLRTLNKYILLGWDYVMGEWAAENRVRQRFTDCELHRNTFQVLFGVCNWTAHSGFGGVFREWMNIHIIICVYCVNA